MNAIAAFIDGVAVDPERTTELVMPPPELRSAPRPPAEPEVRELPPVPAHPEPGNGITGNGITSHGVNSGTQGTHSANGTNSTNDTHGTGELIDRAPAPPDHAPKTSTLELAAQDVRMVLTQQREQGQILTTKLNILFVTNGALLTSLTLTRLVLMPSVLSGVEVLGFFVNFTLLINAFLPRQTAVSPNLEDRKFLERYLTLAPEDYQLQMLVNLAQTYNANKQRLDDVSESLKYSAFVTWGIAFTILLHMSVAYFLPELFG